jgi:HNH endonuclease
MAFEAYGRGNWYNRILQVNAGAVLVTPSGRQREATSMRQKSTPVPCSVDGCERPALARGWCSMHWQRWRSTGNPLEVKLIRIQGSSDERFWGRVDKSGECWEWTGSLGSHGYGEFGVAGDRVLAHRYSYELASGPIPDGLYVCHHCDNRRCVRPDHLFLGTARDNALDMVRKGRWEGKRRAIRL